MGARLSGILLVAGLTGCGESTAPQGPAAQVRITTDSAVVHLDSVVTLRATVLDASGNTLADPAVAWFSFDDAIASVDSLGAVTGHRVGIRRIVAAVDGVADTAFVTAVTGYVAVSAGASTSCGIAPPARVICWGRFESITTGPTSVPVVVPGAPALVAMSGHDHVCGLTAGGNAWCRGWNRYGQVGNGDTLETALFVPVSGAVTFKSISAGRETTCALSTTDRVYCWGGNLAGQLGTGVGYSLQNHALQPVAAALGRAMAVATGGYAHTCALDSLGLAWCWGYDGYGALGSPAPTGNLGCANDHYPCVPTPTRVTGARVYGSITTGRDHTCALDAAGQAWCWGSNLSGQLGTTQPLGGCLIPGPCSDQPVAVEQGAVRFATLVAAFRHTCGLTSAGQAFCWGNDTALSGSPPGNPQPTAVGGTLRFASLSASNALTCGITLSGDAWCWGGNTLGLGQGPGAPPSPTPVRVMFQP